MSWLQTALQGARQAGTGLTERAKDAGRSIAARTQQLEEVVVQNLQAAAAAAAGSPLGARDQEARVEAEAQRLGSGGPGRQAAHALEVVQRWLALLRSAPQPRYADAPAPSDEGYVLVGAEGCAELTFLQLFLRSRALELALHAAAAAPELRTSLRDHALASRAPAPDAEDGPPPAAFARAFVELLRETVGAPDVWLAPLAALLSSDRAAADERCAAWLVRLISEQRLGWEGAAAQETERDVEAIEEASRGLSAAADEAGGAREGGGAASGIPASLAQRGRAAGEAYRSWGLRRSLAGDLGRAAARERKRAEAAAATVAAIAAEAVEYGAGLDARAAGQSSEAEGLRHALGGQREGLQARLEGLAPTSRQLRRDIEEAETTQRELLRQVGQLSEKLEQMRRQRAECDRQEERLVAELQGIESTLAQQLASEDQARQQVDTARALASTVADLAGQVGAGFEQAATSGDSPAARLAAAAERNRAASLAAAVALADREVERLGDVARAVGACVAVAEERERSREAMAALGVSAFTLESDVVGEANISQSLQSALDELERTPLAELDRLREELLAADGVPRAAGLAAALQERRLELEGARARVAALLELPGESVDGFLQSVGIEADAAVSLGPRGAGGRPVQAPVPADDPFLLSGAAVAAGAGCLVGSSSDAAPAGAVAECTPRATPAAAGAAAAAGEAPALQAPAAAALAPPGAAGGEATAVPAAAAASEPVDGAAPELPPSRGGQTAAVSLSAAAAAELPGGEAPASGSAATASDAQGGGAPPAVTVEASPAVAAEPPGGVASPVGAVSAGAAPTAAAKEGVAPPTATAEAPLDVAAEVPPASATETPCASSAASPSSGGNDGGGLMSYHPPARGGHGAAADVA